MKAILFIMIVFLYRNSFADRSKDDEKKFLIVKEDKTQFLRIIDESHKNKKLVKYLDKLRLIVKNRAEKALRQELIDVKCVIAHKTYAHGKECFEYYPLVTGGGLKKRKDTIWIALKTALENGGCMIVGGFEIPSYSSCSQYFLEEYRRKRITALPHSIKVYSSMNLDGDFFYIKKNQFHSVDTHTLSDQERIKIKEIGGKERVGYLKTPNNVVDDITLFGLKPDSEKKWRIYFINRVQYLSYL